MTQCVAHANPYLSHFAIFLQVRVLERENRGLQIGSINAVFVTLGDIFLTPVRYFFHGRDVEIIFTPWNDKFSEDGNLTIAHVASYHDKPDHRSRLSSSLVSSQKNYFRTATFIILLIPGLILGIVLKGLPYLFTYLFKSKYMGTEIGLLTHHFTMNDVCLWDSDKFMSRQTFLDRLKQRERFDLGSKIHTLVIYTSENFKLSDFSDRSSPIGALNPKVVLLVGGRVVNDEGYVLTANSKNYSADDYSVQDFTHLSVYNKISAFNIEEFMRDNNITIPIRVESNKPAHMIIELTNR